MLNVFFYESQDTPGQYSNLFLIQLAHDPECKFILADSATSRCALLTSLKFTQQLGLPR